MVILLGPLFHHPQRKVLAMAVIITYQTKFTPAPRFEKGLAIAQELKRLLGEADQCPELCFVTADNHQHPGRRLVRSKCERHRDGTIHLVARIARGCVCPQNEEKFYFSLGRELMPIRGQRITALIVGYPNWEVSTVVENTHLGTKVTFNHNGERVPEAKAS
jgi:hypothetical protein